MTTLQKIIDDFRFEAQDRASPYLWDDAILTKYANEAQVEACRRARLIEDRSTADVCSIAVTSGTAVYDIDQRVILLRRVKLASQGEALPKADERNVERVLPTWESLPSAPPRCWIPWGTRQIRLIPAPDANDTISLWVVREPLAPMALAAAPDPAVDCELPSRYADHLYHWMVFRALSHRDREEKYDADGAKRALLEFETEFGKRSSAIDETWIARKHGVDDLEGLY